MRKITHSSSWAFDETELFFRLQTVVDVLHHSQLGRVGLVVGEVEFHHQLKLKTSEKMLVLGLEGSANKLGFGIYDSESAKILSNERVTYNGPIGSGNSKKIVN